MNSEYWRQRRLYQDCLRCVIQDECCSLGETRKLQDYKRLSAHSTEFLWQRARLIFPVKSKGKSVEQNQVTVLGGARLPEDIKDILQKRPKYSYEPTTTRPRLLAMLREVADRSHTQDKERLIRDGVDCIIKNVSHSRKIRPLLLKVTKFLQDNNLTVMQLDKEGGFVVMPNGIFNEKALTAIAKNFKIVKSRETRKKSAALCMLKECHLESTARKLEKSKSRCLEMFFTGKTHKPECPLRISFRKRHTAGTPWALSS